MGRPPVVVIGPELVAIRRRLARRAGTIAVETRSSAAAPFTHDQKRGGVATWRARGTGDAHCNEAGKSV